MGKTSTHRFPSLLISRAYNNVQPWRYGKLLEVFGASNPRTYRAESRDELIKLMLDKEFASCPDIQVLPKTSLLLIKLVELIMDELDAPRVLQIQAELTAKANEA
jgi:pyruvate decarboxylase